MPTASQFWDPSTQFFAGGGPVSAGPAGSGGGSRAGIEYVEAGGGYPPIEFKEPLTAAQVLDISLACKAAMSSGQPEPLKQPFTYNGLGTPGLQPGDTVSHMIFAHGQCMTNAEAARRGVSLRGADVPWYYYAVGAAAVGLLAYALTR